MRTAWWCVAAMACGSPVDKTDSTGLSNGDADTDADADSDTDTDTDTYVTPTDPCLQAPGIVELATGDVEATYTPVTAGTPVTLVHGPQGGWHIDVAATLRSPTPDVSFHSTVTDDAGNQLSGSQPADLVALASYDPVTCTGKVFGRRALLLDYTPPTGGLQEFVCSLDGTTLTIQVDMIELATGTGASDTMVPSAALDPIDEPICD